jgi:surface protein
MKKTKKIKQICSTMIVDKLFTIMKKIGTLLVVIIAFACSGDQEELDTTPPEITILGDNPLTITLPDVYTELGATALDDTDGDISDRIEITSTGDFLVPGSYEVIYSVSDAAGNSVSSTREVIVEEGNPVYLDANGITVKATDWAAVGDVGTIGNETYTIVNRSMLDDMLVKCEDITHVCTTKIMDMSFVFQGNTTFNQDIGSWDVSNVTDMEGMFSRVFAFNQDIGNWDVSNVTNMNSMFNYAEVFNQDIGNWKVSNVTDMERMFSIAKAFNQDISLWNVGKVKIMKTMFGQAEAFNQDIGNWDVSNVTDMERMFAVAYAFNQDIRLWDVSKVTNMRRMFSDSIFNQNIGNWDVSNVTNMERMFDAAEAFNQDLSNWNVINVTDCYRFSYNTISWILQQPNFTNCTT